MTISRRDPRRTRLGIAAVVFALTSGMVLGVVPPASADPGHLTLASTGDDGSKGDGESLSPSMSWDGTLLAFESRAANLDPGDMDTTSDIFVKDLTTGNLTLVSTSEEGMKGNGDSHFPTISRDGRFVAFNSASTNLDPDDTDTVIDVYLKDLWTGEVTVVSTSEAGVKGNGDSSPFGPPSISNDDHRVAFDSMASNLDPDDSDAQRDVYVKDLTTFDLELASTSDTGVKGDADSALWRDALTSEGTSIVFASSATNLDPSDSDALLDVYLKDLETGDLTLVSTSSFGGKGDGDSVAPSITDDGRFVGFQSAATNFNPDDTDPIIDVYVKDLQSGDMRLASTSDAGEKGDSDSEAPLLVGGTGVAFHSTATNLDPGDNDAIADVYVKDLQSGDIKLASTSTTGAKGNSPSLFPVLFSSRVAFQSTATNLDPGDADASLDVYVKDLSTPANCTGICVSIDDVSILEGNRGHRRATFTVRLSSPSRYRVTVLVEVIDGTAIHGTDFEPFAPRTVAFRRGRTRATVSVRVKGDRLHEPDETFFVQLSSPVNADISDGRGVGTILNDD